MRPFEAYIYLTMAYSASCVGLFSILLLFLWMWMHKTCAGISAKSQVTLTLTFAARCIYFSSFYHPHSIVFFIYFCLCCGILYSIYSVFRQTLETDVDTFLVEYLIAAAVILSFGLHFALFSVASVFVGFEHDYWRAFFESVLLFSNYLEAVAMLPQFYMIYKTKQVTSLIFYYLLAITVYRFLYLGNWYFGHIDTFSLISGGTQVVFFVALSILCSTKVVTVTTNSDWLAQNLPHQSKGIFVIDLPDGKAKKRDETSDLRYLIDATNEKREKGVVEAAAVHGSS